MEGKTFCVWGKAAVEFQVPTMEYLLLVDNISSYWSGMAKIWEMQLQRPKT